MSVKEKHIEIYHYFDKFRYYLDYLETTGTSFYGLQELRQGIDMFRESLYQGRDHPLYKTAQKVSIDQLRLNLKSVRTATNDDTWPILIDELQKMLESYQGLSKTTNVV